MLFRLLLLFTLLPLAELVILLWIADHTSVLFTVGLVLSTGILGATLSKLEGLRTVHRIQEDLRKSHMPADAVVDALLILVAGAVLITPGVLTDMFGFALLVPPLRTWLRKQLMQRLANRFQVRGDWRTTDSSEIIDAQIISDERDEGEAHGSPSD